MYVLSKFRMIFKRPTFPFILICIIIVTYCDAYPNRSIRLKSVQRTSRDVYSHNHPPLHQDAEPSVVPAEYEESIIPKGKSLVNERLEYNVDKDVLIENIEEQVPSNKGDSVVERASDPKLLRTKKALPIRRAVSDFSPTETTIVYDAETRVGGGVKSTTTKPIRNRVVRKKVARPIPLKSTTETPVKTDAVAEAQVETRKENPRNYGVENAPKFPRRKEGRNPFIPIIESEAFVFSHSGNFHYSYEGGDGTKAYEKGELKKFDDDSVGETVVGNFSYTDKDGNDFALSYTADENGYRPVGAHLPTPPPIPPAIARALKYLATKTPDPIDSFTESY